MSTWGRSSPEDEAIEPDFRLEKVGSQPARWRLLIVAMTGVLLVALLVLKPWDRPGPPVAAIAPTVVPGPTTAPPGPAAPPAPATTRPTHDPIAAFAARPRQCYAPSKWRLLSSESTLRRVSRTLWAASPSTATGPDDPDLPVREVHAGTLRAVGICPPRTPVLSPVAMLRDVVLWQVLPDGTVREVARPQLMDSSLYDAGEAYFTPPAGEGPYWPEGRYVFEIRRIEGPGSKWIGLDFIPTQG